MIQVRLLGGAAVSNGSQDAGAGVIQRHRIAMLALLACAPDCQLSRDKLVAQLWPETDAEAAQNLLRVALHALRKSLGADALPSIGSLIRLNLEQVSVDAVEFEAAVRSGHFVEAVALYRGPFLDGFHLPDAPDFDRWMETQRATLRQDCLTAIRALARESSAGGSHGDAATWWRRAAVMDPYDSAIAMSLMHALGASGDIAGAVQHARVHTRLLEEELGVRPTPALLELEADLREGRFTPPSPIASSARPLVEPATEASASINSWRDPAAPPIVQRRRSLHTARALAGAAAVLTIALAGFSVLRNRTGLAAEALVANRILVLPLRVDGADSRLSMIARMSADRMNEALQRSGAVEVIDSYTAFGLHQEADSLLLANGDSAGSLLELARKVRAAKLVSGSLQLRDSVLDFRVVVTDASEGKVLHALQPVLVPASRLNDGIAELQSRIMGAISTSMDERARSLVAASSPPPSFEAYREFVIGLDRLRENRFPAAWQNFQRAAELDTAFVLASLWGVFALQNEAQFARAESLVNALVPRRASLPAAEQHGLDMFIAEQRNDFEAAYHAARRAADLAPQSNWRYMAGYNAYRIGRPREALHELLDLEPTAGWTTQWTSYWGVRARALHQLEEYEAELKLSNEAMQHVVRASLPPMGILYGSLRSMAALGRLEALDSTFDAALPEMRGARGNLARQLAMLVGNELRAHGHATAAARYYERCLSFGYNAACHYALGHFDQVIDQFSRDSSGADAAALVLARRNSPVEAQRVFDVAAARTSAIGTWSYALAFQKARLAMLMGDRAGAEAIIKAEPQRGRIWELLHESEGGDFKHNDPLLRMLVQTSRRASP